MSTAVATKEIPAPTRLAEQIRGVRPYLERLLPDPSRFGATLMIAARRNEQLLRCDPASVVGAALICAQLQLEPGPAEHVWLIPRRNSNTNTIDCTLLLGYKGMKALAERHPSIASVRTGTVRTGDEFRYVAQPPSLRHVPKLEEPGEPYLWYAIATRTDGAPPHIAVLDRAAVEARRAHSSSPNAGPWKSHYDAMARKSCLRALWPELPSSLDMERAAALEEDGAVVTAAQIVGQLPSAEPAQIAQADDRLVDTVTGEVLAQAPPADDTPPPIEEDEPVDTDGWGPTS